MIGVALSWAFKMLYHGSNAGTPGTWPTRLEDGEPSQVLAPLHSDPDLRALRKSLGDLDPSQWEERTAKGRPRDPWRPSGLIPFVNRKHSRVSPSPRTAPAG